jgi:hypothetical protein
MARKGGGAIAEVSRWVSAARDSGRATALEKGRQEELGRQMMVALRFASLVERAQRRHAELPMPAVYTLAQS